MGIEIIMLAWKSTYPLNSISKLPDRKNAVSFVFTGNHAYHIVENTSLHNVKPLNYVWYFHTSRLRCYESPRWPKIDKFSQFILKAEGTREQEKHF